MGMIPLDVPQKFIDEAPPGYPSGFVPAEPRAPYFIGQKGYLPVELWTVNGDTMIYFVSGDGGRTWTYDPSMDTVENPR